MTEMIFADTFYWVALLSPRDTFHSQVIAPYKLEKIIVEAIAFKKQII